MRDRIISNVLIKMGNRIKKKEAMASEADMPEWGSQEERGIDMEVETAAAVLASGSNAVILKHPTSVATISKLIKALV